MTGVVVFDRNYKFETGNGPDADGLSETLSGINECPFDPLSGLDSFVRGYSSDGGLEGIAGDVGPNLQCALDLGDLAFEAFDGRSRSGDRLGKSLLCGVAYARSPRGRDRSGGDRGDWGAARRGGGRLPRFRRRPPGGRSPPQGNRRRPRPLCASPGAVWAGKNQTAALLVSRGAV